MHVSRGEALTDLFHAGEEDVVDEVQGRHPFPEGFLEIIAEALLVTIDDAMVQSPFHRPVAAIVDHRRCPRDILERDEEFGERVVAGAAAIVDEVETEPSVVGVDLMERENLGCVDNGRVEAGLDAFVQEHRVEGTARRRFQTERDVRDAQNGEDPGKLDLDPAQGLDRLHGVAPQVLLTGAEGKGERIEEEIGGVQPVAVNGKAVQAMGHVQFPAGVACLPVLVDQEADHRGPMLLSETENSINT